MERRAQLVRILADGRFHSGQALGERLGISRGAVWKQVQSLGELGLDVRAVPGRGYRLARGLELLDANAIRSALGERARQLLTRLDVLDVAESTSGYLTAQGAESGTSGWAVLAERQTAGRGRRGRAWVSPYGTNVYLSLLWRFVDGLPAQASLSLTTAVAAAQALEALGVRDLGVKWPNDLVWSGRKLGGILLEMTGEPSGPCRVVVGLGVNLNMPPEAAAAIGQPWADLADAAGGESPHRNRVAAALLDHLLVALARFEVEGFEPFREAWQARDRLTGRSVELHRGGRVLTGRAVGIDASGALLLDVDGRVQAHPSGEVTVRERHS